ncbi:hypothetical protein K1719_036653 [Acacia pycnantha]|nr:hypothetical protein K1719_036653 [Acacia pycnantha]
MFQFLDVEEYGRILRNHPWSINGCLLNLMERSKYKAFEDFDFSCCPVWIQIHNIPLEAMCLENTTMIGGYVGEVVLAEDPSLNGRYEKMMSVANEVVQSTWEEAPYFRQRKEEASSRRTKAQSRDDSCDLKSEEEDLFCIKLDTSSRSSKAGQSTGKAYIGSLPSVKGEVTTKPLEESQGNQPYSTELPDASTTSRGGRGLRDVTNVDVSMHLARPSDPGAADSSSNVPKCSDEVVVSPLAMVPFCGGSLIEVTHGLGGLSLKRGAVEDLVMPCLKRRNFNNVVLASDTPAISTYAGNLRKVRARVRRSGKRKDRGEKENVAEQELLEDDMIDVAAGLNNMDSVFVFKAKGDKHKKSLAKAGGLAVWWLGCISLTVLYKSKNGLHVILDSRNQNVPKIVTFVYGPPKEGERRMVWDHLRRLAAVGSDHHALVIDCCHIEFKSPKDFKFEANWVLHEEFLNVVKSSWSVHTSFTSDRLLELIHRLDNCRGRLVEWSKREAENLVGVMEEACIWEETYWWQRSRISWLKYGDQNTMFFHSRVIQRRQRNKILRLKSEDGTWLEERRAINNTFSVFYKGLFSSAGARSMEQALSYVKKVVTEEDNSALLHIVTDLEIEEVTLA